MGETTARAGVVVLGIGNLLMGDEGVGVHATWQLQQEAWPPGVELVDGGTGGFHLLQYFESCRTLVMIDATMDGQPAGTVSVLTPRYASDYPRTLTAHDIGLRDLVESAALLGDTPTVLLVTVSIDRIQSMCITLSDEVAAALPEVARVVERLVTGALVAESPAVAGG